MQTLYTFSYMYATDEESNVLTTVFKSMKEAVQELKRMLEIDRRYYSLDDDCYDKEKLQREESNAKISHDEWYHSYSLFAYGGKHIAEARIVTHKI